METTNTTETAVETPVAATPAPEVNLESTFKEMLAQSETNKPGPKTTPPPTPTEEVEEDHVENDWIDDELLNEAKERGLSEDDLATFTNAEQYRATMRVADRNLRTSTREHYQPKTQPTEQTPVDTQSAADPMAALDQALASFTTDTWDEQTVKDITGFKDAVKTIVSVQKQQLDQAMQWIAQEQQQRAQQANLYEAQQFASVVEKMDLPELFGESYDKATPAQQAEWAKAFQAYLEIKHGEGLRTGNLPQFSERLVKRALHSEFSDQIIKKSQRAMAQKVRTSAAKRMGGGSRQVAPGPYKGPVSENPVLAEAFQRLSSDPTARLVNK